MRPIIVLALLIIAILLGVFIYNVSAPTHDNITGTYGYGGTTLVIQNGNNAKFGDIPVTITEVREYNMFDMFSSNSVFPMGRYYYSDGNLIGVSNGVTFLKR